MNSTDTAKIAQAVDAARDSIPDPEWGPLETAVPPEHCGGFMFMGHGRTPDGAPIMLYKHGITRHYLNLTRDGQAWEYAGGMYGVIPLPVALMNVYGPDDCDLYDGTRETVYDDQYQADRNARLIAAGYSVIS